MTKHDRMRLKAHGASHKVFKHLLTDNLVANLTPTQWTHLRTLVELGYVDIDDGHAVVNFTISSLVELEYL